MRLIVLLYRGTSGVPKVACRDLNYKIVGFVYRYFNSYSRYIDNNE